MVVQATATSLPLLHTQGLQRPRVGSDESREFYTASSASSTSVISTMASPKSFKTAAVSMDPNDWPLDRVLHWLEEHKFPQEWTQIICAKNIERQEFLGLADPAKLHGAGLKDPTGNLSTLLRSLESPPALPPAPSIHIEAPSGIASSITQMPSVSPKSSSGTPTLSPSTPAIGNKNPFFDTAAAAQQAPQFPTYAPPPPVTAYASRQATPPKPRDGASQVGNNGQPSYTARRSAMEKYLFLGDRFLPTRVPPQGPFLMATLDNMTFTMVDITNCNNAQEVRQRVAEFLQLKGTVSVSVHLTDYFCLPGDALSDMNLWSILAAASGDIVKFLISAIYPSPNLPQPMPSETSDEALSPPDSSATYPSTPSYLISSSSTSGPSDYFNIMPVASKLSINSVKGGSGAPEIRPLAIHKAQADSSTKLIESKFDERRTLSGDQPLVARRSAPPPPLARHASSKYRPELNLPRVRLKNSVSRKPVSPLLLEEGPIGAIDAATKPVVAENSQPAGGKAAGPMWADAPQVEETEDDDEEQDHLWAVAPKPVPGDSSSNDNQRTVSEMRPSLFLKTTMTESGTSLPLSTTSTMSPWSASAAQPSPSEQLAMPLSAGEELRDSVGQLPTWPARRPTTEVLYDNIEQFFPNTDVDRPVIQLHIGRRRDEASSSPATPITPATPIMSASETSDSGGSKAEKSSPSEPAAINSRIGGKEMTRMKSIRVVAREASRRIKSSPPNKQEMLRRKSTKMWGRKVVEMRKGYTITLRDKKQYVWVKGELIGQGTFGKVYLGLNLTTAEMMAVKQVEIPKSSQNKPRFKSATDALYAEVENMKDLDHLNIVQYLGFERLDNVMNLFLEYVPGGSVKSILDHFGRFDEPLIRFLNRQVLDGLSYLHSQQILHRDLKADNLMLDVDGTIKISDFGISRRSRDIYSNDAEMSMQGTIFWMAPEVIHSVVKNEKQGYSAKVDVWSLGCVVLEMYAGRRPWSTEEAIGAMYKLGNAKQRPPIPEDTQEFVSETGRHFLDDCFITDPANRPTAVTLLSHEFSAEDTEFKFGETAIGRALKNMSRRAVLPKPVARP